MEDGVDRSPNQNGPAGAFEQKVTVLAERRRILERTNEGQIEIKANGVKFGRKRWIDRQKVLNLKEQGVGATAIAKQLGIGRAMVYLILKEP